MSISSPAALAGIPIQINTTFTRQNLCEFDAFVRLLDEIRPALWSVFQLVPTGRGLGGEDECEQEVHPAILCPAVSE